MILDFGRFTRRVLLADRVNSTETCGGGTTKHRKSRVCKTRKEAVEDRHQLVDDVKDLLIDSA